MRILLIESDQHLSTLIVQELKKHHHVIDAVYDGLDGYYYIRSDMYDIVILEEYLPSLNGMDIVDKTRKEGINTPFILLLSESTTSVQNNPSFDDVDMCLPRPLMMEKLIASLHQFKQSGTIEESLIHYGDIAFNRETGFIYQQDKSVQLTTLERKLFQVLLAREGMYTSKEQIIEHLWSDKTSVDDNNAEVYISYLRKKIKAVSQLVSIETRRNVGYRLVDKNEPQ